ncbi:MAG: hypothetical protein K0R24_1425 [Gammaproteobacteria bacterium]|nr:hypothetical protein [Gammaproteobacteria bacterium]
MRCMIAHEEYHQTSREDLLKIVMDQAKQIRFLEEQILAYQLCQFAAKSEKLKDPRQLFF